MSTEHIFPRCSVRKRHPTTLFCDTAECAVVDCLTHFAVQIGTLHLAVVLDMYARRVVGWATSPVRADVARETVFRALMRRTTQPGLVLHSDRGSEYGVRDGKSRAKIRHSTKFQCGGRMLRQRTDGKLLSSLEGRNWTTQARSL